MDATWSGCELADGAEPLEGSGVVEGVDADVAGAIGEEREDSASTVTLITSPVLDDDEMLTCGSL
jgi:hypothetical protein